MLAFSFSSVSQVSVIRHWRGGRCSTLAAVKTAGGSQDIAVFEDKEVRS
jgi:hypothetical protein